MKKRAADFIKSVGRDYKGTWRDLRDYAHFSELPKNLLGPYTIAALIATGLCVAYWWSPGHWYDLPLTVLPALLGFTLAAYALLLAFGDEQWRSFLAEVDERPEIGDDPLSDNLLLKVSASFLHFVVIQVVSLSLAIIGSSHPVAFWHITFSGLPELERILRGLGFLTFALSITAAIAAAFNIFHASRWYVLYHAELKRIEDDQSRAAGPASLRP